MQTERLNRMLLGGLLPAIRAARLPIAVALRPT